MKRRLAVSNSNSNSKEKKKADLMDLSKIVSVKKF